MNNYGVIFDWQRRVPVVHGFDNSRLGEDDDDGVSRDYTRCGMVVSFYDRGTGRVGEPGDWIPLRHALKIGRKCRKCFPAALSSPETE